MHHGILNKITPKKKLTFCLTIIVVFASLYSVSCSSEEIRSSSEEIHKGKYSINLNANQTMSGKRHIFEISGDITGPSCNAMKLTVNYINEYANRAHKVISIKNIEENVPKKFSDFDEVFPTKPKTTWKLGEVYVVCQD
jgi:hypothetical protein